MTNDAKQHFQNILVDFDTVMQVIADSGEYWDNSGFSGLKYLFAAGKAYLKGERPEVDDQVNQKVSLGRL